MGQIYLITNNVNNYQYIGLTTKTTEERWKEHVNDAFRSNNDHSLLHKAIRKYGNENFTVCILVDNVEDNELPNLEQKYIQMYETHFLQGHGYNLTYGGEGTVRYNDKEILDLWRQNKTMTEIAATLGANVNTICQRLQLLAPGEARQRYTEQRSRCVIQYSTMGEYINTWNSISEAARETGIDTGAITKCCQGSVHCTKGYIWQYIDATKTIEERIFEYASSNKCCEVDLIDDSGNILKTYTSGAAAEKELKITRGKVSEICNHKYGRKTGNGFLFQWHHPVKRKLVE